MRSTRIAVHCWDRLAGDAIASWLDALPGWLVVGSTSITEDLLRLCELRPPDVLVFQVETGELELVRSLNHDYPRMFQIAVCPGYTENEASRLRDAGVRQVVCVRGGLASLRAALNHVRIERAVAPVNGALTDREVEVLALVCAGLTAAQLGVVLRLSPHTVGNYKRRIFGKLGVQSRSQASVVVDRLGLVRPMRTPGARLHPDLTPTLTHREHDILASIARGESVRQTAHALGIAVKTVEAEQRQLFFKLRVHNRAQALTEARRLGLAT